MNHKTEPVETPTKDQPHAFTNRFLVQIILLALSALLAMVLVERVGIGAQRASRFAQTDFPLVLPWISAAMPTYWLDRSGSLPLAVRLLMLSGILIALILCPTVALFGWRSRRLERAAMGPHAARPPNISSIGYLFCGIVTLFVGIAVVPMAVIQQVRYTSSCENDAARLLRYKVQNDINHVVADAFQYRILPKNAGGGDGSYVGYAIPENLARTDNAEFSATPSSDKVMLAAESAFCATDSITLTLDARGQTGVWRYVGNWGAG